MTIHISLKQLGKRKPVIETVQVAIPELQSGVSLQRFLELVVAQQVNAFNTRVEQPELIHFLLKDEVNTLATQGKVSFGDKYNAQQVKLETAQQNAILAFKDGLYKVFLDDNEIEDLNQIISFTEESKFTFIRLTFLSGGFY